ncbi:MAG: Stk1 family PASTA domain-containing Ser/Thr kinase [Oscillospiraceae bacterium]|nr:Stk1 family PASTA domain-containing Ser/Thr kinase [Oscillospiraceae bacterium]
MENRDKYEALVGTTLDNRYLILNIVGIGGMSVVLKAKDLQMNRIVAVKILNEEQASDEKAVRRFVNESKAVAMLSHPNIVNIFDVAFDGPLKYIVMEYIDGITLKEYMSKKGKLSCREAVLFTEQILKALEHAHEMGVIHRDIKPQNVLMCGDNHIKVADFGIAKLPDSETITMTDKAIGTVYYISPEQASGKPTGVYTDIYSVGVMLYEMVTGRLPFDGDTPLSIAMMQVNNSPVEPRKIDPSIPVGLEQIILKAMRKNTEERFKSARSMLRSISILKSNPDVIFEERLPNSKAEDENANANNTDQSGSDIESFSDAANENKKKLPSAIMAKNKGAFTSSANDATPVRYKKAKRTMFPIIFGVTCAFLLVAGISAAIVAISFFKTQSQDTSLTLTVPELVGKEYNETLINDIAKENFRILSKKYIYDANYDTNVIVTQEPVSGTRKKIANNSLFCDITITISRGKQSIPMPDVTITEYRTAEIELKKLGLEVRVIQSFHDTVLDGYVISTSIEAGAPVNVGDTITLNVSKGQEIQYALMVDLSGLTYNEAARKLAENGFAVGKIKREPSLSPTDTVITQSIKPFVSVPKKYTSVDLTLSIQYTEEALERKRIIDEGGDPSQPEQPVTEETPKTGDTPTTGTPGTSETPDTIQIPAPID